MNPIFQTTDIDLAAYLYARAYPLLGIWCLDEQTVFIFPAEAALSAEAFYEGATVPAKNLLRAVRQIESLHRSEKREYACA